MARVGCGALARALWRRWPAAGLRDRGELVAAGRERIAAVLKHRTAAAAVWSAVQAPQSRRAEPSASRAADAPDAVEDPPTLVVDPGSRRVTYLGTPIPTTPPHHLQRQ